MDQNDYYGGESTSLNLNQVLLFILARNVHGHLRHANYRIKVKYMHTPYISCLDVLSFFNLALEKV